MKKITSLILALIALVSIIPIHAAQLQTQTVTIMNCDTGRKIGEENNDTFIMTRNDTSFTLQFENGAYVDLTQSDKPVAGNKITYQLKFFDYQRYQILMPDGAILNDNDINNTPYASLERLTKSSTKISTGWYITETSKQQPLKILPLGASGTYGVNPDAKQQINAAYRTELSEDLIDYFGRTAFVGTRISYVSSLSDPYLFRHAGYNGYVLEDVYNNPNFPGYLPILEPMLKKYRPDIVLLNMGGNDVAATARITPELIDRWENFVLIIESYLPENGMVLCMNVAGKTNGMNSKIREFNELMQNRAKELADQGYKVGFVDIYSQLPTDECISSDDVHFNDIGYSKWANILFDAITTAYSEEGLKVNDLAAPIYTKPQPQDSSLSSSSDSDPTTPSSFPVIPVIGGGAILIVAVVILLITRKKKGKKT